MASRAGPFANLDMPADRAVRLVALALLADATDAARRLRTDMMDPEALHGFRISIRRMRSWLKLWKSELQNSIRRKDERRLRRIAHATGLARDIDVHLHWIGTAKRSTRAEERPAIKAISTDFKARREEAVGAAVDAATELLARHRRMERRIALHCVDVRDTQLSESFKEALVRTTRAATNELRERLAAVTSLEDADAIHKARISAKRLRFLLEPVQDLVPRPGPVLEALRSLQDEAGTIHDAHVLRSVLHERTNEFDSAPTLAQRLGVKVRKSAVALEDGWLGAAASPFFARVQRLVTELA